MAGQAGAGQGGPQEGGLLEDKDHPWAQEPTATGGRVDLLSLVPLVAILALLILVGSLVWVVERGEDERARTKLATDALWVEQTLRFQLSVDEDMLVRLALDAASGAPPAVLDARARLHIANNPEMLSLTWYDADGTPLRAIPATANLVPDPDVTDLFARSTGPSARPVYADPDARAAVTMAVRTADGAGLVAATVSLPLMLERHVPWWIAEQYAVEVVDTGDTVLAARARRIPDPASPSHAISFDPPIRGTTLRIMPYDAGSTPGNMLILAAIAALSTFAILALLALYRSAIRRRRAELRLRGEMAFRRSMEDSLTVGLRAKDHEGRVIYVNSAFCNLVGWNAADLMGRHPPMPYWSPDRIEETTARHRALEAGGARAQSFETRFRRRDGTEIDVQVYEAPLIDAAGKHRGWMGSVIDITEAKRAARLARAQDESLARTGRLVTLGEMASTLAHELNQPLSAIASYATGALNLLHAGKADPAVLTPALEKLAHQASRAGQIIRRIQDFVRKREPKFSPLSLSEVIADTVAFLAADARENRVTIVTDLADLPPVPADRILIEQVLVNLIRNGMEAMAHSGKGNRLAIRLRPGASGSAVIEIEDDGPGIDPAIAERLFDAFSSTKTDGMGMGLNICRSIVELHRGQLTFRPGAQGGTVFAVTLPGSEAATDDQSTGQAAAE